MAKNGLTLHKGLTDVIIGTFPEDNKLQLSLEDKKALNASTDIGIQDGYRAAMDYLDSFEKSYRERAEFTCNDAERSILVFRLSAAAFAGATSQDVLIKLKAVFKADLFSHLDLTELAKRALSYSRDHGDCDRALFYSEVRTLFRDLSERNSSLSLTRVEGELKLVSGFENMV